MLLFRGEEIVGVQNLVAGQKCALKRCSTKVATLDLGIACAEVDPQISWLRAL